MFASYSLLISNVNITILAAFKTLSLSPRLLSLTRENKGVFLVMTIIAFVSFERDFSVNTDS